MWHFHYVTELNLIEQEFAAGADVYMLYCDAALRACECNRKHELPHCARCIGIRQEGIHRLSRSPRLLPLIDPNLQIPPDLKLRFSGLGQLQSYCYEGFDLGQAAFSSLVDATETTQPDLRKNSRLLRSILLDGWRVWATAKHHLQSHQFSRVYVFNGRYSSTRPWIRACQNKQVPFIVHERSFDPERTYLFENKLPHDPTHYAERVETFWEQHGKSNNSVLEAAHDFFQERPKGKLSGWRPFLSQSRPEAIPEAWDPAKINIAIYSTTEREYASVREATPKGIYSSQIEAFADIIRRANTLSTDMHFYLRLHPNSRVDRYEWWNERVFRSLPNLTIIEPESNISSYALLNLCDKVLTYRSTMGLEATYWGKPAIVLTWAFYGKIGAVYEPSSRAEAARLVVSPLQPKPQENALKFAGFMRCGGMRLPLSDAVNYYTLTFKNRVLETNEDILRWIGHCEKRPQVFGLKKFLREWRDGAHFRKLWREMDGDFSAKA